jgi:hypothetical protein
VRRLEKLARDARRVRTLVISSRADATPELAEIAIL